jgi:hypothetical protein
MYIYGVKQLSFLNFFCPKFSILQNLLIKLVQKYQIIIVFLFQISHLLFFIFLSFILIYLKINSSNKYIPYD